MKKSILIIEDDQSLLEGLQIILEDEGYIVRGYENGDEIEKKALAYTPSLIIVDYRLPKSNGAVIVKKLKKNKRTKQIPIFMMSASQQNMPTIAREAGAEAFFS